MGVIVLNHRGKKVRRLVFRIRENTELLGSVLKLPFMALKACTIFGTPVFTYTSRLVVRRDMEETDLYCPGWVTSRHLSGRTEDKSE